MDIYQSKYPHGYYVYYYLRSQDSLQAHGAKKGTPYYVGKGKRHRAWCKSHTCKIPSDHNNIVIIAANLTSDQAEQIEILHIAIWGRADNGTGILRNRTDGGGGAKGFKHSPEECLRIGERSRRRKHSAETKAKLSQAARMRIVSPETREKHRQASTGRTHSESTKAKLKTIRKTQVFSPETRQKMSESAKKRQNRIVSESTKLKLKTKALERKIKRLEQEAINSIPNATLDQINEFVTQSLAPKTKLPRKSRGPCSEETKRKIGEANKGKSNPHKGTARSEETKAKISSATKGKPKSPRTPESIAKGIATKIARYGKGG